MGKGRARTLFPRFSPALGLHCELVVSAAGPGGRAALISGRETAQGWSEGAACPMMGSASGWVKVGATAAVVALRSCDRLRNVSTRLKVAVKYFEE